MYENNVSNLGRTFGVAVRVGHGSAVEDGQLVGVDVFQQTGNPLVALASEDADFIQRHLRQQRPHHGEHHSKNLRRCNHIDTHVYNRHNTTINYGEMN